MSRDDGDIICVINARGGSKGLPRKNVAKVGGIPLVCRSVDIMLEAETPDYCFVNTDDDEITQLCRDRGAEVPFKRPAELAGRVRSLEGLSADLFARDLAFFYGDFVVEEVL